MMMMMMMIMWIFFLSVEIADVRVGFHPANTDHSQDVFSCSLKWSENPALSLLKGSSS